MKIAAMCMGIILGLLCGIKLPAVQICIWAMNFAAVFGIKLIIKRKIRYEDIYVAVIFVLFFASAFCGFAYDRHRFAEIKPLYGTTVTISGTVTDVDDVWFEVYDGRRSFDVYNKNKVCVFENDKVTVKGKLTPFNVSAFKGDWDARLYYATRGIYGKIEAESIEFTGWDNSFSFRKTGSRVREFFESKIDQNRYFAYKGFTKALLTGSTDELDTEIKEDFRLVGISHLIAVSGLHFGIFLAFFSAVLFRMRRFKVVKSIFVIILVVAYMILIGERASVLRAAGMTILGYVLSLTGRRRDSLTNLMLMGVAICFVNPYYAADVGFQMSFVATLGIVLYSPYIKRQWFSIPLTTMLFMLPVTLCYNNVISLESVSVNIVAVALTPFIIVFGYLGCFVPVCGVVSSIFAGVVINLAAFFADVEFLHISVASAGVCFVIMWVGIGAAVYFMLKDIRIDDAVYAIITAVIASLLVMIYNTNPFPHSTVRFVNMNDYNMVHIVTEWDKNIFVDCGYKADSYMTKYGIGEIYMIIITDDSSDRYSNLEEVCRKREVTAVLLPEKMRENNLNLENCRVLYYNQNRYVHSVDNVTVVAEKSKGDYFVGVQVYDKTICVPSGTERVSHIINADVLCVPDDCTDCDEYARLGKAQYYIHATENYDYYDYGHKYITSREGPKELTFYKGRKPMVR